MANPIVTIEMESGAVMSGELYPELAPNTVNNFIALANSGFYDGVVFHRVIPGFMIQGGDPDGNGTGGPGYEIKGEFSANGFKNDLKHTLGVLSMARTMIPDSAGSQFFIMVADAPHLDGQYAAFGKITENAQAAVDISRVNRNMFNDMPKKPQVIKSIRAGTLNLKDSYVIIKNGEANVLSMHISPYDKGNIFNHDPDRPKKLLLHKREINKLYALVKQDGYALVPLSVYFKDARVKVELGVCKGKKNYDKREASAQRDAKREIDRHMKNYR